MLGRWVARTGRWVEKLGYPARLVAPGMSPTSSVLPTSSSLPTVSRGPPPTSATRLRSRRLPPGGRAHPRSHVVLVFLTSSLMACSLSLNTGPDFIDFLTVVGLLGRCASSLNGLYLPLKPSDFFLWGLCRHGLYTYITFFGNVSISSKLSVSCCLCATSLRVYALTCECPCTAYVPSWSPAHATGGAPYG